MKRMRSAGLPVGLAVALMACTAGKGTVGTEGEAPREPAASDRQAAGDREKPGNDRDKPPSDRDNPGNDREPPGTVIGAPGETPGGDDDTGGECPACDKTYSCTQTVGDQTAAIDIDLKTNKGVCEVVIQGKAQYAFHCDGTITPEVSGAQATTWKASGEGGFTVANGLVCVPSDSVPAPSDGNTSN